MPVRTAALVVLSLLFGLLVPSVSLGDDPPVDQIEEGVEVEVVSIGVHVLDRRGQPVGGLGRERFSVEQDARPVEIVGFTGFRADEQAPEVLEGPPRADAVEPVEGQAPPPERSIVVFLDNRHMAPGGRLRFVEGMSQLLRAQAAPEAQFMLVVYSGALRIAQPFTGDVERMIGRLEEALDAPAMAHEDARRRGMAYEEMLYAILRARGATRATYQLCQDNWRSAEAVAYTYAADFRSSVQGALAELDRLAVALSGRPGVKDVLFVSDGLELRPGMDLFHYLGSSLCPSVDREMTANYLSFDLIPSYQRLTAHANAAGVTIHTFEAAGLEADAPPIGGSLSRYRPTLQNRQLRRANLEGSLQLIAGETGGRTVLNANRFETEIEKTLDEVNTTYSIAIAPGHPPCEQVHVLDVEVDAKHRELRYRRSYLHRTPEMKLADRLLATLIFGEERNPLGAELAVGEAQPLIGKMLEVPVRVTLPLGAVKLIPTEGGVEALRGKVLLVMTGASERGERLPIKKKEVVLDVDGEPTADEAAMLHEFEIAADLLPGQWTIAVAVVDEVGGQASFLQVEAEVRRVKSSGRSSG